MSKKNQHIKELLPQIKKMLDQGMTHKQIEEELGLTGKRPVHELLKRERKKEATKIRSKISTLFCQQSEQQRKKKRSLKSCSSTATKDFSTPRKRIIA